jgi:shikimate kinase
MPELPARVRRVVLVGLMGAGKTTVGQLLAQRLGWTFFDLDVCIETRARKTVAQIFAQEGEDAFRRLEQQLTLELASLDRLVLTPGGGWITQPDTVQQLAADTAVFWLQVSPEEAVRRVQQDATVRPLLQQSDPLVVARRLAQQRNRKYAQLGVPIVTDQRTPAQIVTDILNILDARHVAARVAQKTNG